MQKTCISKDWTLNAPGFYGKVDLPNDYSVTQPRSANAPGGGSNGFFQAGVGTYIKYLKLDEAPRHYILDVDGAYMCASVKLNENQIIMHPHGYTPFLVDLTKYAVPGHTNKITITTNALQPSTRWYSGAGLYRDVFLWTGGDIRIEPWDVFVTTPKVSEAEAAVNAAYLIASDADAKVTLSASIVGADGQTVTSAETSVELRKGEKTNVSLTFKVEDPKLWDTEDPNLYTLNSVVTLNGETADTAETTFGIRSISADAKNGFLLNGKPMKLRGGCIHHDHGVLGAADFPAACTRKLSRLKASGFNALRIAHNPPSLQLLETCDRLGILVMDEAFDMWNNLKGGNLNYHLWFADWYARDIASMVRRDRNHPCVISYSIGNEIPESDGRSNGDEWSARLAAEIRSHDNTRLVTSCTYLMGVRTDASDPEDYKKDLFSHFDGPETNSPDNNWATRTEGYFAPLDMAGYNYAYNRYKPDHERFPERVMWGSETHAIRFYTSWNIVKECSWVIGDFTWTAYDNLGETGTGRSQWARDGYIPGISLSGYPWRSCYQGDLDLCGYRRPQSYFREAVWIGGIEPKIFTTHPEHYGEGFSGTGWHWYDVLDSWTFEDRYLGKPVKCEVYTDADEIEWFQNGKSLGRSVPDKAIASFTIPYEKGEIAVIAYKDGRECGRSSLHTVGAPAQIAVTAETDRIKADHRDLCYFDISVTDLAGDRIPAAKTALTCTVNGGELLGIFSGDPANEDQYGSNACHAFEGRAVAIVRTAKPGQVTITVAGENLASGSASVKAE